MAYKFDFADGTLAGYVGKKVKISFVDGEEMTGKVLGYTSAVNNDDEVATMELFSDKFNETVEIPENEIATIEATEDE